MCEKQVDENCSLPFIVISQGKEGVDPERVRWEVNQELVSLIPGGKGSRENGEFRGV